MTTFSQQRKAQRNRTSATQPIVLIGAARSGTKIVRDVLAAATGAGRVPYDVGFVWRYGNERVPHDVLDPSTVSSRVGSFIRSYVDRYARGEASGQLVVVEKTVGNALRVPFVNRVLPDAVFVHLIRDGVDVAESTRRQWLAPPDRRYLAEKLRHFPVRLAPTYGRKYAVSQIQHYLRKDARVGTWGPRYPGIDDDVQSIDLLDVCAEQWRTCVESARDSLRCVSTRTAEIRYEELVADPHGILAKLLDQLEFHANDVAIGRAAALIESGHAGQGGRSLSTEELQTLQTHIGATLADFGYPPALSRKNSSSEGAS